MKEKEKILRFDPKRYLKSIRQKARPEWFDVKLKHGTKDVNIDKYTLYTLDDKKVLLSNVQIKLSSGQKYGLVGLNGSGKTTLLRRMSRYDIKEFPKHLRILHVEQEILGDETTVLEYVLSCDVVRRELVEKETALLAEQKTLTDKLQSLQENKTNENGDSKVNDNNGTNETKTNEAKEANGDGSENKTENGNNEAKTNESKDNNDESKVDEWSDPKKVQDRLDKIEGKVWVYYFVLFWNVESK